MVTIIFYASGREGRFNKSYVNKKQTYYLISRILALDFCPGTSQDIIKDLPKTKAQWQALVSLGSSHLVLPAVYLSLKRHQLLIHLPEDLEEYLQYVHDLNVKRNGKIIQHCKDIRALLHAKDIAIVFMKGTGHLLDGLYGDIGERMMYDIDVLVAEDEMLNAARLLEENGFRPVKEFLPRALASTMHYPLLQRDDFIAGIEVHRLPTQYFYRKNFSGEMVFSFLKKAHMDEDLWVMNNKLKILHNFIHSQLMHGGHYHGDVSLRDLYDMLLLSKREPLYETFAGYGNYRSKAIGYQKLMYKVFRLPVPENLQNSSRGNFFLVRQEWTLNMSKRSLAIFHLLMMGIKKYISLPLHVIWNKDARNYVFARLLKPSWYASHFKALKRHWRGL